ncbi:MAG TPA: 4Fe-4S cluster-binding domain-containing protein [Bacteroidales bacterium]|nr:4Fe-4S cluster-binding domain-containing protein [Bacteroidales bacterium]HPR11950.1 4Fe-4S cluster-binding domain-containing protein [Bacteroidales bacterium]HRW85758.1 4Fe-4S cluster-binding domain-containing protein [Bacteroidales bacterium]
MNLIVIDKCSNSCPYCFAQHEMKSKANRQLSKNDIKTLLSYIEKVEKPQAVNVIGGEPFLYNDLAYLLNLLYDSEKVKSITVFTGGIFNSNKLETLRPFTSKITLLFNLNQKSDYKNDSQYELVHKNICLANSSGIPISIGYNIYNESFNKDEIIDYCYKYGIEILRLAVAKPPIGIKNDIIISPGVYKNISGKILDFLEDLTKMEIKAELDCMLPKCFFTDLQLARLAQIQPSMISALGKCGGSFDIDADLSVFRCFATSTHLKKKLTDFESIKEVSDYFTRYFDRTFKQPDIFKECADCEYAHNQTCQGDCLSYYKHFNPKDSYDTIVDRIHSMLSNKELGLIPKELRKLPMKHSSHTLLASYYYYYSRNERKALHFARKTINMATTDEVVSSAKEIIQLISDKNCSKI